MWVPPTLWRYRHAASRSLSVLLCIFEPVPRSGGSRCIQSQWLKVVVRHGAVGCGHEGVQEVVQFLRVLHKQACMLQGTGIGGQEHRKWELHENPGAAVGYAGYRGALHHGAHGSVRATCVGQQQGELGEGQRLLVEAQAHEQERKQEELVV